MKLYFTCCFLGISASSTDDIIQEYLLASSQSAVSDVSSECLFIDENHRHQCEYRRKGEEELVSSFQNNHAEHQDNENSFEGKLVRISLLLVLCLITSFFQDVKVLGF